MLECVCACVTCMEDLPLFPHLLVLSMIFVVLYVRVTFYMYIASHLASPAQ